MALRLDLMRRQIRAFAQWLNLSLETPGETQARVLYQVFTSSLVLTEGKLRLRQPLETTLIRIAVDLRIFDALKDSQKSSKSLDDLASVTKADPALLGTGYAFPF